MLTTQNTGPTDIRDVVVRDVLPPHVQLESGSVKAITSQGTTTQNDKPLFDGGINAGNYAPGGGFYIMFSTKVLGNFDPCEVRVRNLGYMKSDKTPEQTDYSDVIITRENCQPEKPVYRCDALEVTSLGNRKFRYTVKYTEKNAKLKQISYNFGDNTTPMLTDKTTVEHQYTQDGTYTTKAALTFTVNGKDVTVNDAACAATITSTTPKDNCPIPGKENLPKDSPECKVTPVTPSTPVLPVTGPGEVVAVFAAVSIASAMAFRVYMARKLS